MQLDGRNQTSTSMQKYLTFPPFVWLILRPSQYNNAYIDDRSQIQSQIQVHTDERSSLVVTHPSITKADVP